MHVTIDERNYSVIWRYDSVQKKKYLQKITTCSLKRGDEVIATGNTVCYKGDCFRKNEGRKISMARALHGVAQFGKEVRTQFWNAYREMRHGQML